MKKATKNLIGLFFTGVFYFSIIGPIIIGETIRFPYSWSMFGVLMMCVIGFPLVSFIIPGIIAFNEYVEKKPFWKYFYYSGWIIYSLILIVYSFVLNGLKYM
ncbi:MAG TPA: hypothetical protein VIK55_10850 [Paludibacter sp.]